MKNSNASFVAMLIVASLALSGCATFDGGSQNRATIEDIGSRKSANSKTTTRTAPKPVAPATANASPPSAPVAAAATSPVIVGRDFSAGAAAPKSATGSSGGGISIINSAAAAPVERPAAAAVAPVMAAVAETPAPPELLAKLEPLPAHSVPRQNNRAVASLLETAAKQTREGRNDAATATLERALGIEPSNGLIWSRLAEVHLQQGHYAQAIQMATKSNVLMSQPSVQSHNWRIVALAKEASGDSGGAQEAQRQADQLATAHP